MTTNSVDTFQGKIIEVSIVPVGSNLAGDYAAGVTSISLDDASGFDVLGGQLTLNDNLYTYSNVDYEADTLTISPALVGNSLQGDQILVYPQATEKIALVELDLYDDVISARIPHSLQDRLDDGIRDVADQETALVSENYGTYYISDIIALTPELIGTYIDFTGVPGIGSDGLAPGASPTPTVVPGIGSLFVNWLGISNSDAVTYEVHISTSDGFTPGAGTLVGETDATTMNIRTYGDGSTLMFDTDYYIKVIAKDEDGAATSSSQAGPVQLKHADNTEISSDYVYAGDIYANQIVSGTMTADLTVSGKFKTAESGQRVEIAGFGIRQYGPDGTSVLIDLPTDPGQIAKFSGILAAFGLTVYNGLELRGQDNVFAMGSVTTLATTPAGSSTPPSLTVDYETVDSGISQYLLSLRGAHRESDGAQPTWISNFFRYSVIKHGLYSYNWPTIVDAGGTSRSTRDVAAGTMIRTTGGQRWVQYAGRVASGGTDVWGFEILDPSTITANGVAPTSLFTNTFGQPNFVITYKMGRCFSATGASALENNFAFVELNTYVTPDTLTFRRYACTDTSITQQGSNLVVSAPLTDMTLESGIRGVAYGSSGKMGFAGTEQNIWVVFTGLKAYVYSSAGVRLPDLDFPLSGAVSENIAVGSTAAGANGFVRFEGNPVNGSENAGVNTIATRYTNTNWTTESSVWWVGYTWYDSNATGGNHETDVSVLSSITMKKRARLTITIPDLPDPAAGQGQPIGQDDVNSFRVYMQRQATEPARTALWKQNTQPADLATAITYSSMPQWSSTSNPPATTDFPSAAAAIIQSSGIGDDGLPKIKLDGNGNAHFEALDVSGGGSSSFSGKAFLQLFHSIRSQARMSGGGQLSVSSSFEVSWSERFIMIGLGRQADNSLPSSGYFSFLPPSAGVTIPGYGGASDAVATANGIPLAATFVCLWVEVPYGTAGGVIDPNSPTPYRLTRHTSDFIVPNNWVLIAIRNGDGTDKVDWATGPKLAAGEVYFKPTAWTNMTLVNSWSSYSTSYSTPGYRLDTSGRVILRGLMAGGTANVAFWNIPTALIPIKHKMFVVWSAGGVARIQVYSSGTAQVTAYVSGGANTYVSLDQVSWDIYGE